MSGRNGLSLQTISRREARRCIDDAISENQDGGDFHKTHRRRRHHRGGCKNRRGYPTLRCLKKDQLDCIQEGVVAVTATINDIEFHQPKRMSA